MSGLTAIEVDALFASKNLTEANGRLDAAVTVIDNRDKSVRWVKLTTTAGGVLTLFLMNFDQSDFAYLQQELAAGRI